VRVYARIVLMHICHVWNVDSVSREGFSLRAKGENLLLGTLSTFRPNKKCINPIINKQTTIEIKHHTWIDLHKRKCHAQGS